MNIYIYIHRSFRWTKLIKLLLRRCFSNIRLGVLGTDGSVMSRIDASLWDVLNVKALGHRRGWDVAGANGRGGVWVGGGDLLFFVWKFLFADLTKVSGFLNMCFFTRMFFVKCEDIALVCHWEWNPRCEAV